MNSLKRLFYRLAAPFRLIGRLLIRIFLWPGQVFSQIRIFFSEEPEEAPITETLTQAVANPAGMFSHLDALRKHLTRAILVFLIATTIAAIYNESILQFMTEPVGGLKDVIAIDVTEPLSTVMKTSLLVGFALALPYIAFELYLFIAPALRARSRIWGLLAIPAVLILFVTGMAFSYYVMLPTAVPFLLSVGGVTPQIRLSSIVNFVTRVLFWIGLSFEFPLLIFILAGFGLVNSKQLLQNWRIAVVVIAIVAALVTPTIDPISMGIVMAPLIVLYFLSIALAVLAVRNRAKPET